MLQSLAPARRLLLAGLALAALAAPARAQVFGGAPANDVQGLNLAGGGSYVEGYWLPYTRLRFDTPLTGDLAAVAAANGVSADRVTFEEEGRARASFGVEGRYTVPTASWLFGTAEYRYERYDRARVNAGRFASAYQDIDEQRLQTFRVGAGVRAPGTPFYARAEYLNARLDGDNRTGGGRDDGYAVHGGVAQPLTTFLGVRAEAGYQNLGSLGHGFVWQAGGNLNLTPRVALTGGYREVQLRDNGGASRTSARVEEVTAGLRFQFAP